MLIQISRLERTLEYWRDSTTDIQLYHVFPFCDMRPGDWLGFRFVLPLRSASTCLMLLLLSGNDLTAGFGCDSRFCLESLELLSAPVLIMSSGDHVIVLAVITPLVNSSLLGFAVAVADLRDSVSCKWHFVPVWFIVLCMTHSEGLSVAARLDIILLVWQQL